MFKKFKERKKEAEKRLRNIELELGLRDEPKNREGGLVFSTFVLFGGGRPLHKRVSRQQEKIDKLEKQLRELRNYFEIDYTAVSPPKYIISLK